MTIARFDPFNINRFERLMHEMTKDLSESAKGMWAPPVDIKEADDKFVITAELPGMKLDDIHIELTQDSLSIRGERKLEEKEEKENYVRVERFYGTFGRTFSLGVPVDADKVKATYKDGVLSVTVPKSAALRPRKVVIEHEG